MFLVVYLQRELRRRRRQTIAVSAGLAVAVGLVITTTAVSRGVSDAQATILESLYGVGTDVTVTQSPEPGEAGLDAFERLAERLQSGTFAPGETLAAEGLIGYGDEAAMGGIGLGRLDGAAVDDITQAAGVRAAAGALHAVDVRLELQAAAGGCPDGGYDLGGVCSQPSAFKVAGIDPGAVGLGPLSGTTVTAGRGLESSDASADAAVVDVGYAAQERLQVGSTVTIAERGFEVVGLVRQPPGTSRADVYIPLAHAQALAGMAGEVNTIYVAATSAAAVADVREAIAALVPSATVTTADSLAGQVSRL